MSHQRMAVMMLSKQLQRITNSNNGGHQFDLASKLTLTLPVTGVVQLNSIVYPDPDCPMYVAQTWVKPLKEAPFTGITSVIPTVRFKEPAGPVKESMAITIMYSSKLLDTFGEIIQHYATHNMYTINTLVWTHWKGATSKRNARCNRDLFESCYSRAAKSRESWIF